MNTYNLKWIFSLIVILLLCCGCTMEMGDSLFALPNLPTEYVQLQKQLETILQSGAEYTYAEEGLDKQAVQMTDLDGDGKDEVIAFFMTDRSSFRTYLFEYGLEGYYQVGYIECYGRRLHRVDYPVVDSQGKRAIALSWSYDNTVNYGMTVSGYDGVSLHTMLETQYTQSLFTDIDQNGVDELFVTEVNSATGVYTASAYALDSKQYTLLGQTYLDDDVRSVVNMQVSENAERELLWYLDCAAMSGGYMTDVLMLDLNLVNLSPSGADDTKRVSAIYSADIDSDGIIEVPRDSDGRFEWYSYSSKERTLESVTYHNLTDGWYIFWPENWSNKVKVQRTPSEGVVMTTFYVPSSGGYAGEVRNTLLTVYSFTGDNKDQYYQSYTNIRDLETAGDTIYGFIIVENDYPQYAVTEDKIYAAFHLMQSEWTREDN